MHSGYTLPQAEREAAFARPERPRRRTEMRPTACPPFPGTVWRKDGPPDGEGEMRSTACPPSPGTVLGKGGSPDEAEEARPDACRGLTKEAAGSAVPGK